MQIHELSAEHIRNAVTTGKLSAVEVAQAFIDRIGKHDPEIGAFLNVLSERALDKARAVDQKRQAGEQLGKLAGVPIGIKDNIHIRGEVSSCGSRFLATFRAPFESTAVKLLEQEDAILLGKTNMDEFAMGSTTEHSALQETRNPWNYGCVPGGSSGGSAAAVAARLCPIALGSDTGGSIRQPAALCGVLGMKPTYGRVSRYGLVAFGSSLDQIGPFATNARDIGLVMEVLGQPCTKDSTSLSKGPDSYLSNYTNTLEGVRVGYPRAALGDLSDDMREHFDNSLAIIKDLGAEIIDINLDLLKYNVAIYYILATAEASTNLARFDGIRYGLRSERANTLAEVYDYSKEEGFGNEVKRRILLGTFVLSSGYQDAYYRKAQKVRTLVIDEITAAFAQCDVIALPTSPTAAWKRGALADPMQEYLADLYTITANLAGLPAISVPSGFTDERLPIGIQFMGPQTEDVRVCSVAHAFEQATGFSTRLPKLTH